MNLFIGVLAPDGPSSIDPSGLTGSTRYDRLRASHNVASSATLNGSRFDLRVPEKRRGSCGMMASPLRRSPRPTFEMSTPSIIMEPDVSSTRRNRAERNQLDYTQVRKRHTPVMIELFPAPVLRIMLAAKLETRSRDHLPTIPIFSPACTVMEIPVARGQH